MAAQKKSTLFERRMVVGAGRMIFHFRNHWGIFGIQYFEIHIVKSVPRINFRHISDYAERRG